MDKPLITILTPCYNNEKYMQRYIDNILNQTYDNIELILINDGSTDKTEEIILLNKDKLEKKCSKFIYIKQKNQGVGSSINNGLKLVNGKYLTWPDCDDILYNNYLETKVKFMENNFHISLCFNPVEVVNENEEDIIIDKLERIENNDSEIFKDFVLCKNAIFAPITSCIKTQDFWNANNGREIFKGNGGQNWQMLLPLLYNNKCGYIKESLGKYVIRSDSHSHTKKTGFIAREIKYVLILINTINKLNKISNKEKIYYNYLVLNKYSRIILREFFIKLFLIRQIKKMFK